jgi:hypothetical protein
MEKKFWLDRQRESVEMAHNATCAEARLVHFELAGRYGVEAVRLDKQVVGRPGFSEHHGGVLHRAKARLTQLGAPARGGMA